jgi:hypothetical protein
MDFIWIKTRKPAYFGCFQLLIFIIGRDLKKSSGKMGILSSFWNILPYNHQSGIWYSAAGISFFGVIPLGDNYFIQIGTRLSQSRGLGVNCTSSFAALPALCRTCSCGTGACRHT